MDSANILLISGAESYDRRGQKLFSDLGTLHLVDRSEPSVTDSDQGCVACMPLVEASLKQFCFGFFKRERGGERDIQTNRNLLLCGGEGGRSKRKRERERERGGWVSE